MNDLEGGPPFDAGGRNRSVKGNGPLGLAALRSACKDIVLGSGMALVIASPCHGSSADVVFEPAWTFVALRCSQCGRSYAVLALAEGTAEPLTITEQDHPPGDEARSGDAPVGK